MSQPETQMGKPCTRACNVYEMVPVALAQLEHYYNYRKCDFLSLSLFFSWDLFLPPTPLSCGEFWRKFLRIFETAIFDIPKGGWEKGVG